MPRITASLVALLLFASSLAAAVGQVRICIGDGHVSLATPHSHPVALQGCCGHAHSCTDIIVNGISHAAPIACKSADLDASNALSPVESPRLRLRPAPTPRCVLPDHPPPLGLLIAQHTVRRL